MTNKLALNRAWRKSPNGVAYWAKRKLDMRNKIIAYKHEKGCMDCGNMNPIVLQFHHRNGNDKSNVIGRGINLSRYSSRTWNFVIAELEKCDVLCANCHLIRHHTEQSGFNAQRTIEHGVMK